MVSRKLVQPDSVAAAAPSTIVADRGAPADGKHRRAPNLLPHASAPPPRARAAGRQRPGIWRQAALLAALLPLLQTGTCVDLVVRSAINGFIGGATPLLDQALADALASNAADESDSATTGP